MKYRRHKLPYFSVWLAILTTMLSGAILIPLSTRAIAQVSQSAESNGLVRAKEVTQGFFDFLIAGEFEQARKYLSPNVQEYLSAEDLEQQGVWQRLLNFTPISPSNSYVKVAQTQ